jgi:hypothetical protein
MSKYNNSKIYKIIDNSNGNIYIGSTIEKYISNRLGGHVKAYKKYLNNKHNYITSFEIIKNGNYVIVLIENVNCETKEQLHARERYYIESMNCVNIKIPARSRHEHNIQYKDEILQKRKEYRNKYKDEIAKRKQMKCICICGSEFCLAVKARHERTIKHQTYLKNQAILVLDTSTPETR